MEFQNYKIKVKANEYIIEVEGDKDFVIDKFNELKTEILDVNRVPSKTVNAVAGTIQSSMPSNLNVFLKKHNISIKVDEMICVVFWLYKKENLNLINQKDIEECYKNARLKAPSNMNREIRNCVSEGWLLISKEKKENINTYSLSVEGEEYVDSLKMI